MRKLILENYQSPGDILMLTAAIRDIHMLHPGEFETDLRTACPDLWKHNPHVSKIDDHDPDAQWMKCHYPLIHHCNTAPFHFIHGFHQYFNEQLNLRVSPQKFHGDIHLSEDEKHYPPKVARALGRECPYWIIDAGGKYDFTIKWWSAERYQAVVDHFQGKLLFVQVGEYGHYHPDLDGVLDLRGRTSVRELIQLMHHAEGVLCPVTFLMHLAAAVPTRESNHETRPCVVVAGGREPTHWEAYPHHQYIHTIGALWCCRSGGCWRSRTIPLGDGSHLDQPKHLCLDVRNNLPRCMDMISADEVIHRIELYIEGGRCEQLTQSELSTAAKATKSKRKRKMSATSNGLIEMSDSIPRVIHFLPCGQLGGLERCVLNLCKQDPEHNVGVVLGEEGPIQKLFVRHQIPTVYLGKARHSVRVQNRIRKMVEAADILNLHTATDFGPGYGFRQRFDKPFVVTLQWYCKAPLMNSLLICASPAVAKIQAKEARTKTILNGVDLSEFKASRSVGGNKPLRIVRVCRPQKCATVFWTVIEALEKSDLEFKLTVVGERGRSTGRVRCVSSTPDVREHLRNSEVFLYTPPPKVGAHDLAVIEAMAMGVVPVVSDEVCVRDSIDHGVNGFLLDSTDIKAFTETICLLSQSRSLLSSMSQAAVNKVENEFSVDRMAREYFEAYQSELASRTAIHLAD